LDYKKRQQLHNSDFNYPITVGVTCIEDSRYNFENILKRSSDYSFSQLNASLHAFLRCCSFNINCHHVYISTVVTFNLLYEPFLFSNRTMIHIKVPGVLTLVLHREREKHKTENLHTKRCPKYS